MSAEIVISMLAGLARPGVNLLPGVSDPASTSAPIGTGGAALAVLQNIAKSFDVADTGSQSTKTDRSDGSGNSTSSRAAASAQRLALGLSGGSTGGSSTLHQAKLAYAAADGG